MTMNDGQIEYKRVMTLSVLKSEENNSERSAELFILDKDSIRVGLSYEYEFLVDDHITQNIGTIFEKVELLNLADFAEVVN